MSMPRQPQLGPPERPPRTSGRELAIPVILVGFDGSAPSWGALSWAYGEARRAGGRIVAAFVSSSATSSLLSAAATTAGLPYCEDVAQQALADQAAGLCQQVQSDASDQGMEVEFVQAKGDPATELVALAEALRADLLVVGKSSKLLHHISGSVAKRLSGGRRGTVLVIVP